MTAETAPFTLTIVRTEAETRTFIDEVLMPIADRLSDGLFSAEGLLRVSREQDIYYSDEPGDWAHIGFSAQRINPDIPDEVLFNIFVHNATDTIPFPDESELSDDEALAEFQTSFLLVEDGEIDANEDEGNHGDYEELVVEELEFYISTHTMRPVRERDWLYVRDGETIGVVSHVDVASTKWIANDLRQAYMLARESMCMRKQFDRLDLTTIAGILGRLGLLQKAHT